MKISFNFKEIIELYKLLQEYKVQRHLSIAMQKEGLFNNLSEEKDELFQALMTFDGEHSDEIIDALCDIFVFALNAFNLKHTDESLKEIEISRDIDIYPKEFYNYLSKLEFYQGILDDDLEALTNLYASLKAYAYWHSYNFYKAMLETIKEISSRTGKWDDERKKFIKDTSDEAKAKWYKANYDKAKIGE